MGATQEYVHGHYELFDTAKHGGSLEDTPIGHVLFHFRCVRSVRKPVGWVRLYHWISPVSRSEYTLCVPKGIITFQRSYRSRFLGRMHRRLEARRVTGRLSRALTAQCFYGLRGCRMP